MAGDERTTTLYPLAETWVGEVFGVLGWQRTGAESPAEVGWLLAVAKLEGPVGAALGRGLGDVEALRVAWAFAHGRAEVRDFDGARKALATVGQILLELRDATESEAGQTIPEGTVSEPVALDGARETWRKAEAEFTRRAEPLRALPGQLPGHAAVIDAYREAVALALDAADAEDWHGAVAALPAWRQALERVEVAYGTWRGAREGWVNDEARLQGEVGAALLAGRGDVGRLRAAWGFAHGKAEGEDYAGARAALTGVETILKDLASATKSEAQETVPEQRVAKSAYETVAARIAGPLALASRIGAVNATIGGLITAMRDQQKVVSDAVAVPKYADALAAAEELARRIEALVAAKAQHDLDKTAWEGELKAAAPRIARVEDCGPIDGTLDPLKAAFDAPMGEARIAAGLRAYGEALTKLRVALPKADAFILAKDLHDRDRARAFAFARSQAGRGLPDFGPITGAIDDAVGRVAQAMEADKTLGKSKGLERLVGEARLADGLVATALAGAEPAVARHARAAIVEVTKTARGFQAEHKQDARSKDDREKFAQAEAIVQHFAALDRRLDALLPILDRLDSVAPRAIAANESESLKALGWLEALAGSGAAPGLRAAAEAKRRALVGEMLRTATTRDRMREVCEMAGGDFKASYARQDAKGPLTATAGESRARDQHGHTRVTPPHDAENVDRTRRLADRLIAPDGTLELAALFACDPEGLKGETPSSRQTARALTRLRADPEAIAVLEAIEAPPADSTAARMVRATLGLPADAPVTAADARKAALAALMAELRQKDVGSCFATQVAITIHDTDPKAFLRDIAQMMSEGAITRYYNGEKITIPVAGTMSDKALETSTVKLTRGASPNLTGSSSGGTLDAPTKLQAAPAFQAAFNALGVPRSGRGEAMDQALARVQASEAFAINQNEKALRAAVAKIGDAATRQAVFKAAMTLLTPDPASVKLALRNAMAAQNVPTAPVNQRTAAEGAYDTLLAAPEFDVEPGLVVRQMVMDKVGLTEADLKKAEALKKLNEEIRNDPRMRQVDGEGRQYTPVSPQDDDLIGKLRDFERIDGEMRAIRPKIAEMEELRAACCDAFTGGEDNRLLRSYEYTLTSLAEKGDTVSSFGRVQKAEKTVFEDEFEDLVNAMPVKSRDRKTLYGAAQTLLDSYHRLFAKNTTRAYDGSIRAATISADGSSSRGGIYLYDTQGISNPADWIRIDDARKYTNLVQGTMMLAWTETFAKEKDKKTRETSRALADAMAEKVASAGFQNKTAQKAKDEGGDGTLPWQKAAGGFSENVIQIVEQREPNKVSMGTPTDPKDLMKKVTTQLRGIWNAPDSPVRTEAATDPEVATVNAGNAGVHAFSLLPGDKRLRGMLESGDTVDQAVDRFQQEDRARWTDAMTRTMVADKAAALPFITPVFGTGVAQGVVDAIWNAAVVLAGGAAPVSTKNVADATKAELKANYGQTDAQADGWCATALVSNLVPPVPPAALEGKLAKVAKALKVPEDLVPAVTRRAKAALDLKDPARATMTDIRAEMAAAMAEEGLDGTGVDQGTVTAALREPAGVVFADSNWGDSAHRVKYAMVVNPMSGAIEMWQMNEDGSGARKMDDDKWVKKEWSTVT